MLFPATEYVSECVCVSRSVVPLFPHIYFAMHLRSILLCFIGATDE